MSNLLSNSKLADRRISIFVAMVLGIGVLAAFGVFNGLKSTDWLNPINGFIIYFALFCQLFSLGMLLIKDKLPGTKEFSNYTYVALIFTLGYGIGLVSCGFNEPVALLGYPTCRNALGVTMLHWCIYQFATFTTFVIFELYDSKYKVLPNWLRIAKIYIYGFSMVIGISTSFVSGSVTVSNSLLDIYGINVPAVAIVVFIGAIVSFSVLRGLHKGMAVLARITMVILAVFLIMCCFILPEGFFGNTINAVISLVTDFWHNNVYHNTQMQNEYSSPIEVWNLGWAAFVAYFIVGISKGRSFRSVIATSLFVPTILGMTYLAITGNIGLGYASDGVPFEQIHSTSISGLIGLPLVSIILMIFLFTTSCDSQTYSLDTLVSRGSNLNIVARKLMWIILEIAFVSIILLSGAKAAVQGLGFLFTPLLILLAAAYIYYIAKFYINKRKES